MFVFSSRRRHTRLQGDWSSDVCSSDLVGRLCGEADPHRPAQLGQERPPQLVDRDARGHLSWTGQCAVGPEPLARDQVVVVDRKSTRLNSSHLVISYAVFCLKKKKKNTH